MTPADPATTPATPDAASRPSPTELADAMIARVRTAVPILPRVAAAFADAGHELYLVGGSVRDECLAAAADLRRETTPEPTTAANPEPTTTPDPSLYDLDFTTDATPEQILAILTPISSTVWDTGIEFGTVSAAIEDFQLEITTFRADLYDGDSRKPEVTFGDSLDGDLIRRDFRMNAMAVRLDPQGAHDFCDPLDGLADLLAGVLDTPADPRDSFRDDPLRMLRACRFVSQLGVDVAERVRVAMADMAGEIARISAERINAELGKLLCGTAPSRGLELLTDVGLADIVLPELPALRMTSDDNHHHKDVYLHSLKVLDNVVRLELAHPDVPSPNLVLRMAALLHDIGKPATRAFTEDGRVTFWQHDIVGARMARKRLRALKFSKREVQDISTLIALHMRQYGYEEQAWTDSGVRRYVADAGPLLNELNLLVRADCTTRNRRLRHRLEARSDDLERRIAEIREKEDLAAIRPDLNGQDIMALLGLEPGPAVGRAWSFLKELRLEEGPLPREEAERRLLDWWQNTDATEGTANNQEGA